MIAAATIPQSPVCAGIVDSAVAIKKPIKILNNCKPIELNL